MFVPPADHTLRGFHFEPSGFSRKKFYVNMFFMPLCIPAKHVHFTFGHRVGHGWDEDETNLETTLMAEMQKDVPFLLRLRTPRDVANALEPLTKPNEAGYVNPHCYEALAYALVQAGEATAAANVIDTLLRRVNPTVAWEGEVASRARLVRDKLLEKPEEVHEQLTAWEAETIRNLGMENFSHV